MYIQPDVHIDGETVKETRAQIKDRLWFELETKAKVLSRRVNVEPGTLDRLSAKLGTVYQEQVYDLYLDRHNKAPLFPSYFKSPHGLIIPFEYDENSPYSISDDGDKYYLTENGGVLFEITFGTRPPFYGKQLADGTYMKDIAILLCEDCLGICYSNECSFKERGEDCLFCSINQGKREVFWKNPRQIAETVAQAINEGSARRVHFTGGVVPERRELDYYIDAMSSIQELTEGNEYISIANCAAPVDLNYIDKLKEIGFTSPQMNLEIWDKNIYSAICPGKSRQVGGWEHWVEALEYAAKVFGFGYVGSNFVVGIEPKKFTLEGVDYLASKGVVASISPLRPMDDTAFAGVAEQKGEWVLELAYEAAQIQRKNGLEYRHLISTTARRDALIHDIYRIEGELFPAFKGTKNDDDNLERKVG